MRAPATTVSKSGSSMPQAMRSRFRVAAGCSGCSAWSDAICSREKTYFSRSFAANAAFRHAAGCNSFSPIAARICVFICAHLVPQAPAHLQVQL